MKKLASTIGLLALLLVVTSFTSPTDTMNRVSSIPTEQFEIGGRGSSRPIGQFEIGGRGSSRPIGQFEIGGRGSSRPIGQ
jgi:hypothetical protein